MLGSLRWGLAGIAALSLVHSAASAQSVEEAPLSTDLAEVLAKSTCLSSTVKTGKDEGQSFVIAVPSERAPGFIERGFIATECGRAALKLVTATSKRSSCEIAEAGNRAYNLYFWQKYSFAVQEACELIGAVKISTLGTP